MDNQPIAYIVESARLLFFGAIVYVSLKALKKRGAIIIKPFWFLAFGFMQVLVILFSIHWRTLFIYPAIGLAFVTFMMAITAKVRKG